MPATLIWLACVATMWTPSIGVLDGYHTEIAGVPGPDVATNQFEICLPEKYTPTTLRVQAFNYTGAGEWSDPMTLERVHDFDADGDGIAGFGDFGKFIAAFGCRYQASGLVTDC